MSADYLAAVRQTDRLLGTVLDAVTGADGRRRVLVVLTSDHGGIGRSHADPAKLADYRIPFLVWGFGVPDDRDLYALNPGFRDPGTTQPGYQGPQPIRNRDLANLATTALGLPPVPGSGQDGTPTLAVG